MGESERVSEPERMGDEETRASDGWRVDDDGRAKANGQKAEPETEPAGQRRRIPQERASERKASQAGQRAAVAVAAGRGRPSSDGLAGQRSSSSGCSLQSTSLSLGRLGLARWPAWLDDGARRSRPRRRRSHWQWALARWPTASLQRSRNGRASAGQAAWSCAPALASPRRTA
jgi:hypothetical protein